MAITKILHMNSASQNNPSKHLYNAIRYIQNPEKTMDGLYTGTINCMQGQEFSTMMDTKSAYNKVYGRQGYHFIISFADDEVVSPETAFEITQKYAEEVFGKDFEVAYAVHTDSKCMHGHLVINSVSCRTGGKFQYKNGDWAKIYQPMTNKLCKEYGLRSLNITDSDNKKYDKTTSDMPYHEWLAKKQGRPDTKELIKSDINMAISLSNDYRQFIESLKEMGYQIKEKGSLTIKPPWREKYIRASVKNFGEGYTREDIQQRLNEKMQGLSLSRFDTDYQPNRYLLPRNSSPPISAWKPGRKSRQKSKRASSRRISGLEQNSPDVEAWQLPQSYRRIYFRRYRKINLNVYQKSYIRRLYQVGRMDRIKANNPARFRKDIMNLNRLKRQTLYIVKNGINNFEELMSREKELSAAIEANSDIRKNLYKERYYLQKLEQRVGNDEANSVRLEAIDTRLHEIKEQNKAWRKEITIINGIKKDSMTRGDVVRTASRPTQNVERAERR